MRIEWSRLLARFILPNRVTPSMPTTTDHESKWQALQEYVSEWFAEPDLEALRIALAIGRSHFYPQLDPVWLLIMGPSGCGKTTLFIRCLQGFEGAHLMGDITPKAFLSGKRGGSSFLTKCGERALLLFKDFTTFLSMRQEDRNLVAGQLREIHDGEWSKLTGEIGEQRWKGKMTIIAASTPAIERYWGSLRELGERFVTVRVRVPPLDLIFQKMRQDRDGREITRNLQEMTRAIAQVRTTGTPPPIPDCYWPQMDALAKMIAQCRQTVHRAAHGKREIFDITAMEAPTRITSALMTVARLSADMRGTAVLREDMALAVRLAIDSIPSTEWRIIEATPPTASIDVDTVAEMTGLTARIVQYHAEKLQVLRIMANDTGEDFVRLAPDFSRLREAALGRGE